MECLRVGALLSLWLGLVLVTCLRGSIPVKGGVHCFKHNGSGKNKLYSDF